MKTEECIKGKRMDRYEEAMNRMLQWEKEHPEGYDIDAMKSFVFPELEESGDERIREEIIRFLYAWRGDSKVDKWIAYLEKQNNPFSKSKAEMQDFNYKEGDPDDKAMKRLWGILTFAEDHANDLPSEEVVALMEWIEKQKELPFVKDVMLGYPGVYFYDGERMHFGGNPAVEEKQKEQKPAEWSEEDEEMIERICANLEYLVKEAGCDSKLKEKLEERIKWMRRLKSLRPQHHWKPSEYTLSLVKKVAGGEMLTRMEQMAMETLCNDLQKLL